MEAIGSSADRGQLPPQGGCVERGALAFEARVFVAPDGFRPLERATPFRGERHQLAASVLRIRLAPQDALSPNVSLPGGSRCGAKAKTFALTQNKVLRTSLAKRAPINGPPRLVDNQ
jgi:hypothetical protein